MVHRTPFLHVCGCCLTKLNLQDRLTYHSLRADEIKAQLAFSENLPHRKATIADMRTRLEQQQYLITPAARLGCAAATGCAIARSLFTSSSPSQLLLSMHEEHTAAARI